MATTYTTILSGQSVSGPFTVDQPHKDHAVECASLNAAGAVQIQFGTNSGVGFRTLNRDDGTATARAIASGTAPAVGLLRGPLPSPWARLTITSSVNDVTSFALHPLNR